MRRSLFVLGALCALIVWGAANQKSVEPSLAETTPAARMESTNKDLTRGGPGIFGEYWWANRFYCIHKQIESLKGKDVDLVLMGDSIMHFWEWKHPQSWKTFTQGRTVLNCGYGGDRTQHVIWRIQHGELDGYKAKAVLLMIGTNNNSSKETKPENVLKGIEKIVALIREKQPWAKIILHPIFPRGVSATDERHAAARGRNDQTNVLLKQFADANARDIIWVDFNAKLVDATGWVPPEIMADKIHPTDKGYDFWMEAVNPVLDRICGPRR